MRLAELLDVGAYPWLAVGLAALAIGALALIAAAVLAVLLRRVTRRRVAAAAVVEFAAPPGRLVLVLLALHLVMAAAPAELPQRGLAQQVLTLLLIGALTWLAMRAVAGIGEGVVRLHPATGVDNLHARSVQTQTRVLTRSGLFFVLLIGLASGLMTFPGVRQVGASLLASAGVAGLVAGMAARPVLGNLIAGLQIALSQPIRLDDVLIVKGEFGRVEEITATYVVLKIWDERRLVVPLQWIVENPIENWTRTSSQLLGTVFLWVDYRVPLAPLRAELARVCAAAPEWDGRTAMIQMTDADPRAVQLRVLLSAADASRSWDLRCRVREALVGFLQREHPHALPRVRLEPEDPDRHPPPPVAWTEPPLRAGKGDSSAVKEPTHPELTAAGDARAPADAPVRPPAT